MINRIISFFARQHLAVNMAGAIVAVAGIAVFFLSPKEILPEIDFGAVSVSTRFPGASSWEVEDLVTVHIEDAVKNLSGVERVTSLSGEGFSLVNIELSPSLKNTAGALNDIKDAVEKASLAIPAESSKPEVKEASTKEFQVITAAFSGKDYSLVRDSARKAAESFGDIRGVSSVQKLGYRGRTLWINVKKEKLKYYELPLLTIAEALKSYNVSVPAGTRDMGDERVKIRIVSKTGALKDISGVIVKSGDIGHSLRISDIANVKQGYEDLEYSVESGGMPCIIMTVFKLSGKDSSVIARQVRKRIGLLQTEGSIERDVSVSFYSDTSNQVSDRISLLVSNGAVGLLFILIILFFTLDRKLGFWITIGLPVTYGITFLFMKAFGVGFDMLSLFGLIVVLGILDDDAIVVGENVSRHRAMGKNPFTAAVEGTAEVAGPVLASYLTTTAAFLPLLLIGGLWGKFLAPIAIAVILSITGSILECFLVMPSHLALSGQGSSVNKKKLDLFKPLYSPYSKILNFVLRRSALFIIAGMLLMAGISILAFRGGVVFAENNIEAITVRIETLASGSLAKTAEVAREAQKRISAASFEEIEGIYGFAGIEQDSPGAAQRYVSNVASLKINLKPSQSRTEKKQRALVKKIYSLLENMPGVQALSVKELAGGGPGGRGDIDITFTGDSHASVKQASREAYEAISKLKTVTSITFRKTECRPEFDMILDRKAVAEAGVPLEAMASTLRGAVSGIPVKTLRIEDEPVELRVRLDPEDYRTPADLLFLRVPSQKNSFVRLSKLASFQETCGIEALSRYDGKPSYSLSGTIDKTQTSIGAVNISLIPKLNSITKNIKGVSYRLGGDYGEIKERFTELGLLFLLAVFLMYTILASFFNSLTKPLIVLVAVPLSLAGVMAALVIHRLPISFPALIAVFALTGVSVNNAVVMIDFLKKLLTGGKSREEAVLESAVLRFKSIMISSFTVSFGILPLGYGFLGGQDAFLRPFAIALGWGILFSGPGVTLAVPAAYVVYENLLSRIRSFFTKTKPEILFSENIRTKPII